jgi:hypothetical protein
VVSLLNRFASGDGFEAFAGHNERSSPGFIGICEQLNDPARDIGRGGRYTHALNEVSCGYPEVAGITRDGMLPKLSVWRDTRRKRHEPHPKTQTIRFFLTIICNEQQRAFGARITARFWRKKPAPALKLGMVAQPAVTTSGKRQPKSAALESRFDAICRDREQRADEGRAKHDHHGMMTGDTMRLARTLRKCWYWGRKRFDE